jgi:adenylosuccinate lyase
MVDRVNVRDEFLITVQLLLMVKIGAERHKTYRINYSKDKVKYEQMKKKARLQDNSRRKTLDAKSLEQLRAR